jgi:hypothetical protein
MSCDKLVFDLSQEIEGSPAVFVKKDWISILDNQNGVYSSNQCVIDTSQLSNSNKYMSYREAYLQVPMLLTAVSDGAQTTTFNPSATATSADYAFGLKNWFGSVIHSITLDYNGTTIVQQTPFINMWNSFKLMTTLSWADVETIGATIGFYPDDPLTWGFFPTATTAGSGTCNNNVGTALTVATQTGLLFNNYKSGSSNTGLVRRIQFINYDEAGRTGASAIATGAFSALLPTAQARNLWKSYVLTKTDSIATAGSGGCYQVAISATIYLKHLHSFFQQSPLLKGVFMKITLALNNSTVRFTRSGATSGTMTLTSSNTAVGGICPIMVSATTAGSGGASIGSTVASMIVNLSVGKTCLDSTLKTSATAVAESGYTNISLNVPAYTFNPSFESAYLSSPVKTIKYTDVYQYQVNSISALGTFNNLITNGIAGLKSILVLPFFSAGTVNGVVGAGVDGTFSPYMSPFDPAGAGPTSPLCLLTNFNVVVSGQNMLYNTERYSYEQFNQQLLGVNAVNGGLTDGLTSSLISAQGFEMEYCYYYVDVSRMLPVEETVPKSVQIIGQSQSAKPIDMIVFCEYGCSVSIDVLTGARV